MAECAIARCVQERRSFKKELQKWGKNVLYLAGLERVAEELVGPEKWNKLMESTLLDVDNNVVVDWEPEEICYFCKSRKQPPLDPAKGVCSIESLAASNGSVESDGNLSEDNGQMPSPPPDQPLDLSIGSKHAISGTYFSPHSPSFDNGETATVLKVPQIPLKPGMKKRLETTGCKRSYTEDELQAALRDIQSGKLGTRRAAVIYGIPRSTLRNKVYKLALERDNHRNSGDNNCQNSKEKVALSMEDLVKSSSSLESTTSASESLRQLLRNRMAEKFTENKASELQENLLSLPSLSHFDYSQTLAPLLSQVLANVHEMALAKLRSGNSASNSVSSELPDECRLSILPELIRRLAEERFEEECNNQHGEVKSLPLQNGVRAVKDTNENASTANKSATNNSSSHNVILKIPSYKPMKTLMTNDNQCQSGSSASQTSSSNGLAGKGIGVSLREIIAKSITQRAAASAGSTNRTKEKTDVCNGSSDSNLADPPTKKKKLTVEQENNRNAAHKSEKRTRPKRGRYRNYDRDNLAEAVRAVQRGEMSVHRAGSYYGVPHSTLEYKVKERHLLRPRKRDLKNKNALESANTSTKLHSQHSDSSTNSNSSQNAVKSATSQNNDSKSFSGLAVSFPSHMPMWQSSPFFSFDFNQFSPNHFFASQMMRKLQEDALLHADDSSSSGGKDSVSLLSSIIRSSLQAQAHAEAAIVKASSLSKETIEGPKDVEVVSKTKDD